MVDSRWSGALLLLVACLSLLQLQATSAQNVTVGFTQTYVNVSEASMSTVLVVELSRPLEAGEMITLTVSASSSTAGVGEDYSGPSPTTLTFDDTTGQTMNVSLNIINDNKYEPVDEMVSITLTEHNSTLNNSGVVEFMNEIAEVTIEDNESLTVSFMMTSYSVVEGNSIEICIEVQEPSGSHEGDITFNITSSGGSAQASDYTTNNSITFPAGIISNPTCIPFEAISMDDVEDTETVNLTLSTDLPRVFYTNQTTVVMITDPTTLTLSVSPANVSENGGPVQACVTISPTASSEVNVTISTLNGTAIAPGDFIAVSETVTLSPGTSQQCVNITINDDNSVENDETFIVTMMTTQSTVRLNNMYAEVTILADSSDRVKVTLADLALVSENDRMFDANVSIANNFERSISVNLTIFSNMDRIMPTRFSFVDEGDYSTMIAMVITFEPNGTTERSIRVYFTDDDCLEMDEVINVTIESSDSAVVIVNPTEVRITDTDYLTIGFNSSENELMLKEGSSVPLTVGIFMGCVGTPITVDLNVTDLMPSARVELNVYPLSLVFNGSSDRQDVTVSVPADTVLEYTGLYSISLNPVTLASRITFNTSTINVTVLDEPANVTVGLSAPGYSVVEGAVLNVCVQVLTGSLERSAQFRVTITNGTAYENVDFSAPTPSMVTIAANSSMECVNIMTNSNGVVDVDKMFSVGLQAVDPSEVTVVPNTAQVNITEGDSVTIGLTQTNISVVEGQSVDVCANLSSGSLAREVQVELSTLNGTARASVDYVAIDVLLTFSSNMSMNCVEIQSKKDMVIEDSENLTVVLMSYSLSSVVVLQPATGLVTIIDAPTIYQNPRSQYVLEGDNVTFTVNASGVGNTYQWLRDGEELVDMDGKVNGAQTTMLTIYDVSQEDFGNYTCNVTNDAADTVTNPAELALLPNVVIMTPPASTGVLEGQNVNLTCSVKSLDGMAMVTWSAVDQNDTNVYIPESTIITSTVGTVTTSVLTIEMADSGDAGVYTCSASNRLGTAVTAPSVNLSVITVVGVNNIIVSPGQNATFFCDASGNPALSYRWAITNRGGVPISPVLESRFPRGTAERVRGNGTANLTILNVTLSDNNNNTERIVCTVNLFEQQITRVYGDFEIYRISLTEGPVSQTVTEGETIVLNCTAQNTPDAPNPLTFNWQMGARNNVAIDGTRITAVSFPEGNGSNVTTNVLTIRDAMYMDDSVYYCFVTNNGPADGIESENAEVTVRITPLVTNITVEVRGDTTEGSVGDSFDVNAREVNEVIFEAIATPSSEYITLYQLVSGTRAKDVTDCDEFRRKAGFNKDAIRCRLPVLNVSIANIEFEVVVGNDVGNGTARFSLRVQDVPEPVNLGQLVSTVVDLLRVRLTWPIPRDNNAPITSYIITYCAYPACAPVRRISIAANSSDLITSTDQRTESYTWQSGVNPSGMIAVNITATNRVGEGSFVDGPVNVSVATIADATPTNIRTSALTPMFAVVVWYIPPTAMGAGIEFSHYMVRFVLRGETSGEISRNVTDLGTILNDSVPGVEPGRPVEVTVTSIFTTPNLQGAASPVSFEFPRNATPIFPDMSAVSDQRSSTRALISWSQPTNTVRQTGYVVNYINVLLNPAPGSRRRRASSNLSGSTSAGLNANQAEIITCPFSSVTARVDAVYEGGLTAPVVKPVTFQSAEDLPSKPRSVVALTDGPRSLLVTWQVPSPTNGIITNYVVGSRISSQPVNQLRRDRVNSNATTFTVTNLEANTMYTVVVLAETRIGEGDQSDNANGMTGFGVTPPPTIAVLQTAINGQFNVRFTVSRTDGPIQNFQVIVSRLKPTDSISLGSINSYSEKNRDLYVTFVGQLDDTQTSENVDIGTGVMNGQYLDQQLNGNTDYYIFVRVFSMLNTSLFNDSEVSGPIRFSPGLNTVAVIAPIAAIAGILIIVLVVLLVVAYCTMASPMKRFGGYVVSNDVERRHGGKGGASMEMRRTRLFSPVLNVGTSDVFTSAGQPTTLICEASGTPAPSVSWTRYGEPLDKERFIQLADGSLFINDTDLQDEGAYSVRAVNSAGEAEEEVRMTVLRPTPPEPDSEHLPIKVGEFSEKIALVRAEDDEGLEDEYADVELDWNFTSYHAKLNINKNKNRYINIIPYDHSRVVLSLEDHTPGSDYINASFIDAYQRPNGYIASQGPIPSTFPDFWRMIWELDSPTIVMVTNLKEEDKVKCNQYWPSYGTCTYGNVQVTLKEVENLAEYSIRTFNISPLAGQSRVQMPVREVRQFHFLVWPDHGVPTYATNLLSFRKRVLKYHPEKRGPMVVHCSAGVGRTGTFITIDYMLKQMEAEGTIDIFNFVRHMRYRRNYMVQTSSQYIFIHDALLEAIMCGDNSIKAPELKKKVEELQEVIPETGLSTFETQFQTLKTASPPDEDFDCSIAALPDNASKNRSKTNLPANDYRVVLSSDKDQSDYICASYVDNYRERNAFIVTQAPLAETVKDFWRMIWETKSAAIVMLTELEEDGQEMCVKYWPSGKDEACVHGGYQVTMSEDEKNRGDYITRRFKLSPLDNPQESRMVSQFHFIRWSKTQPPKDSRPMIDLIDELQRAQRKSGNMPITVHCDDGIGRTGAFCTLYSVLERVKTEQVVDVFQAVKTLRIQRTGLLSTLREYEFVHYAVIEFLETFSEYQNFK